MPEVFPSQDGKISRHSFEEIKLILSTGLTLDEYYYLHFLSLGEDLDNVFNSVSVENLIKKGVLDSQLRFTDDGYAILKVAGGAKVDYTKEFIEFWNLFPKDSSADVMGEVRLIKSPRMKRQAMIEFSYVTKRYPVYLIMDALKAEIAFRIENSNFKYMKGPVNYLKQEKFLDFTTNEDYS